MSVKGEWFQKVKHVIKNWFEVVPFECNSRRYDAVADEMDATKKECTLKPELMNPRLKAAGADNTTIMLFDISVQVTACTALGNVEATCNANKKCNYDASSSPKCSTNPKWVVVTLANGGGSHARSGLTQPPSS